jgi:hypothetical protein
MFSADQVGHLPKGFESALTGQGAPGRWEVVKDTSADGGYALAQLSTDRTDYRFPLSISALPIVANAEVVARFKPVSGKVDQAGGVVIRLRDPQNYYVARANATENNVRFYRVVNGKREQLASVNTRVAQGDWHTLSLRAKDEHFEVVFDGRPPLKASDKTFSSAGKAGLWTKADSVTYFDHFEVRALP